MEHRSVGPFSVSVIGLGCNNLGRPLDETASLEVIHAAIDLGINFFDTADNYGGGNSEVFLGKALKSSRSDVVIATKVGQRAGGERLGFLQPEYVKSATEACLGRLDTDYIDLLQVHWPDPDTPIGDTLGAMNELVESGKVRAIGCSNFSREQLEEARARAGREGWQSFVSLQSQYSLLDRTVEAELLPYCAAHGMGFIPYFPLANGLLTGKYRQGEPPLPGTRIADISPQRREALLTDEKLQRVERLLRFSEERGHPLVELAYSWLLSDPIVSSVIGGVTSVSQLRANIASTDWTLSPDELAEVERLLTIDSTL